MTGKEMQMESTGRAGTSGGQARASFRCAECGGIAAVLTAVAAGGTVDMGPPLGATRQRSDGIVVGCFGGTAWKRADPRQYQAVRGILAGAAPDPAAVRRIDRDLVPFYCPDCAQNYCRAHWRARVQSGDGFYDCTIGRCPHGHEHMIDD
jgi:hypothetical protein